MDMEVDVTDPRAVGDCVREVAPQAVLHLAAWTDVDGAEEREEAAEAVNAPGQRQRRRRRRRGRAPRSWCPRPTTSSTGRSGRALHRGRRAEPARARTAAPSWPGERAALAAWPDGTRIARTAWLYGAAGRNFVDTMRALGARARRAAVVDDQEGSPTWTRDLAPALEALLDRPAGRLPHRRRRLGDLGGLRARDLRGGRHRLPRASRSPPPSSAARPRGRRTRPSP